MFGATIALMGAATEGLVFDPSFATLLVLASGLVPGAAYYSSKKPPEE